MKNKRYLKNLFFTSLASLFIVLSILLSLTAFKPLSAKADTATTYATTYNYLVPKLVGKSGSTLHFTITNPTSSPIVVEYNAHTCQSSHAMEWEHLEDLTTLNLSAGVTADAYVKIVGTVRCVAFSYVAKEHNERLITYATDYNSSKGTISLKYCSISHYAECLEIEVVSGSWILKVTNPNDYTIYDIEYNSKLCYESDAANWKNLKHVYVENKFTLLGHNSTTITITPNGNAGTAAISYVSGNNRYITYAYDLSTSKSISVKTAIIPA